jgi:hypothetical protein
MGQAMTKAAAIRPTGKQALLNSKETTVLRFYGEADGLC